MDDILLSSEFVLYPKTTCATVTLTNSEIIIKTNKTEEVISTKDIIGCHILKGNRTTSETWYLCIFAYPLKKKIFKGLSRQRYTKSLGIASFKDNDENRNVAEKWKKVIKLLITGRTLTKHEVNDVADAPTRKFIVYVNPFSGRGRAMHIYQTQAKSVFAEAEIKHDVVKTEYSGHAKELVTKLNLEEYDGIIIISGDGLVHEVINGLMERPDWKEAIKTPLGVIPGGSGNALAASVVYASTGFHPLPSLLECSFFEICRGNIKEQDIMAIELHHPTEKGKVTTLYGILGTVIGLIADIDIESEKLRFLGGTLRSNIYGVMKIATLHKYSMTVSYLPPEECSKKNDVENELHLIDSKDNSSVTANVARSETKNLKNHLLVPIDDPIPDNWKTIKENFVQVTALNLTHLGCDTIVHADGSSMNGKIMLGMIKETATRSAMLKYWGCLEDGTGLIESTSPGNAYVFPCTAFRVVPHSKRCKVITLDGEPIQYGPFQGQIHNGLARVFGTL